MFLLSVRWNCERSLSAVCARAVVCGIFESSFGRCVFHVERCPAHGAMFGVETRFAVARLRQASAALLFCAMRFEYTYGKPIAEYERSSRTQWPAASMTWSERLRHSEGDIIHRDAGRLLTPAEGIMRPSVLHSRGRQDAPAGSGNPIMHSPLAIERNSQRNFFNASAMAPATSQPFAPQWDVMRARTRHDAARQLTHTASIGQLEGWQRAVRNTFPRATGHHGRGVDGKQALAEQRAASRWADRLARREEQVLGDALYGVRDTTMGHASSRVTSDYFYSGI